MITKPGQAVGSLDYMAPEQIRGEEVAAAADVYSLGCVLFECLVGEPPFARPPGRCRSCGRIFRDGRPTPLGVEKRSEVPKDVSWAVLRGTGEGGRQGNRRATIAYSRMVQVAAGVPPLSPRGDE